MTEQTSANLTAVQQNVDTFIEQQLREGAEPAFLTSYLIFTANKLGLDMDADPRLVLLNSLIAITGSLQDNVGLDPTEIQEVSITDGEIKVDPSDTLH